MDPLRVLFLNVGYFFLQNKTSTMSWFF